MPNRTPALDTGAVIPFFAGANLLVCTMPSRYGTGELYGFDFCALPQGRIRELSSAPFKSQRCPFKTAVPGNPAPRCNKKGVKP